MADPELEQIRQQRLAQLQSQHGGTGDPNQGKQQEERMQAMEEAKHTILAQALSQDARARCNITIGDESSDLLLYRTEIRSGRAKARDVDVGEQIQQLLDTKIWEFGV